MNEETAQVPFHFFKIGLIVTGKGERRFMPVFLRALTDSGRCTFKVLRKISQRSPVTSPRKQLKMVGSGKLIPDKDAHDIGFPAREWLSQNDDHLLLLIDDLEFDRREWKPKIFSRYREALDKILPSRLHAHASVHFMVNMVEAYYFAHAAAVNAVLGTNLSDYQGDVETIRHPKNKLKGYYPGFDEVEHGEAIVKGLDLDHVLYNPNTCASLRAMFAWCHLSMGIPCGSRFQLAEGIEDRLTGAQAFRLLSE